jgi:hypothetical protein
MRNIFFIIVLFWSSSIANCQIFKGTVYDRSTDSTLSFATIYIGGTSIGTYSDLQGNFELDISKYRSLPISISMLGYYTITLPEHSSNKMYNIYLSPKVKEINEIVVTGKKGNRESYLRIFKREFLGETENAVECDILNEKDLRFSFSSESSTLKGFSSKPILIHNKNLGYTITYYLDKFNYTRKRDNSDQLTEKSTLVGNYLFKEDSLPVSESERRIIQERRKSAYLGSRMHFFRLLYLHNLTQSGEYNILLSENVPNSKGFIIHLKTIIDSNSLIYGKDSLSAYLRYEGELAVTYNRMNSILILNLDSAYFEKNGYYDPNEISFTGDMSKQRIGDLLPFEYSLK